MWTFNGNFNVFAEMLSKAWKRKVIVPERLRGTRIHKRVEVRLKKSRMLWDLSLVASYDARCKTRPAQCRFDSWPVEETSHPISHVGL